MRICQPTVVEIEKENVYHCPIGHFANEGIWFLVDLDHRLRSVPGIKIWGERWRLIVVESRIGLGLSGVVGERNFIGSMSHSR